MRIISLINLKGGVAKTTTTINMAVILSKIYGKRVLIVDNDVQANVTKHFELHNYDCPSVEDIYRQENTDINRIIKPCYPENAKLDLIPANMNLDDALTNLLKDSYREQITPLKNALKKVENEYDFCLIDNPPGVGINILNALVCSHDIIVPIKLDKNSLDGMQDLYEIVEDLISYNPNLDTMKCLITMYKKNMYAADTVLRNSQYDVFNTRIRYSEKVDMSTFSQGGGLLTFSPRSAACVDYKIFVKEYIESLPASIRKEFSYAKNKNVGKTK